MDPFYKDFGLFIIVAVAILCAVASAFFPLTSSPTSGKLIAKPIQFFAKADDGSLVFIRRVDLPSQRRQG